MANIKSENGEMENKIELMHKTKNFLNVKPVVRNKK